VADGSTNQRQSLKTLVVQGAEIVTGTATDAGGNPITTIVDHRLTLQASDIVTNPTTGQIDRTATARAIATRAYSGFTALAP